jgi:hypothetical protein
MPVLTSYTEKQLAEYMKRNIDYFASMYGWQVTEANGDYQDQVNATLVAYGVNDIALATNIRVLEAYASVEAWRKVVHRAAADYTYATDGQSMQRAELYKNASQELALVQGELSTVLAAAGMDSTSGSIGVGEIGRKDDPYNPTPYNWPPGLAYPQGVPYRWRL